MKRVVLHIGWPKTGTTSLQLFCRAHRAWLAEHGVAFPDLDASGRGEAGHEALVAALLTDPPPHLSPLAEHADALLRAAVAAFAASDAHTLLLSHETLSQARGVDHARLHTLIGGWPVTILAVVRTLDRWIESLYAQAIVAGHAGFRPLSESRLGRLAPVRALPRLQAWRTAWPDAELRVVSFERLRGTRLVPALFDAAGMVVDAAASTTPENPSPSALATLFVAYATLGAGDFTLARPLLAAWRALGDLPVDGRFGLLPPAFKAGAREAYRADLAPLRRRFALDADDPGPCTAAELDYRHTLTGAEYHGLLDQLAPHAAALPLGALHAAYVAAAPRLG